MDHASHAIRVRAPRDAVWEYAADPYRVPNWYYGARKIEFVTDARSGVGAQWRETDVYGPVVLVRVMEITEVEHLERFRVESVTRPRLEVEVRLEAVLSDSGEEETRVTVELEYEMPFGGVGRVAEPALGEFVGTTIARRSAEALKRRVELKEGSAEQGPRAVPGE